MRQFFFSETSAGGKTENRAPEKIASIFFGVGGATKKVGVRDSRRRRRRRDRGCGRDVTKRDEDDDRVARCVLWDVGQLDGKSSFPDSVWTRGQHD